MYLIPFLELEFGSKNMIRDFSDLDIKSPSVYGMRPLLDFEKTCYHKELVIKVLKEFADYESSSDPHIASPEMAAESGNVNGFHQPHDSQVNVEKVERASSLAKDLVATPVGTQFRGQGVMGVVPGSSSKCVPSSSKKQVTFGLAVPPNDLSQPYDLFHKSVCRGHLVGKSSSQSVPAHVVDDVIPVAKDHDSNVLAGGFNSPDHFTAIEITRFWFGGRIE
ncbi:unnamed protein product [Miscanthus lutarioriparius]|uniref:Uncharacterized protein n=1 Tax=Miscanthus lutarioriparius TaxID=422564 RepID=A0A811MFS4_9POAL|nr:unnamed protein product [Miscanthus lutarioriparius]